MKKAFFMTMSILSSLISALFWGATSVGIRSLIYRISIGLQPRFPMSSIILELVLAIIFTLIAVKFFKLSKGDKAKKKKED